MSPRVFKGPRLLGVVLVSSFALAACASPAAIPNGTYVTPSVSSPSGSVGVPSTAPSASTPTESSGDLADELAVTMTDEMRFAPESMTVKAGVPITFVVTNTGLIVHEFFVGNEAEQTQHAAEMAMGGMTHGHANALSLKPGESGSLTMTFEAAGALLVGCHEAGHYEAGMMGTLTVID